MIEFGFVSDLCYVSARRIPQVHFIISIYIGFCCLPALNGVKMRARSNVRRTDFQLRCRLSSNCTFVHFVLTVDQTALISCLSAQHQLLLVSVKNNCGMAIEKLTEQEKAVAVAAFTALGLCPELAEAAASLGWKTPSPIQEQAIPNLLQGECKLLIIPRSFFVSPLHKGNSRLVC